MADRTKIEWADASINPIRARNKETGKVGWFCEHTTPGCENCYSETLNRRLGTGIDFKRQNRDRVELFIDDKPLTAPLHWKKPRRIFWNSMTDTFGEFVPDEFIDKQFAVMAMTPQHTHLVLTKRAKRMREYVSHRDPVKHWSREYGKHAMHPPANPLVRWRSPLPHVWLGVSVEDQARADERIPGLLATPAAVRFISAEPLLGPVFLYDEWIRSDLAEISYGGGPLDWVICGGESGPGARPMHPDWARSLRDQCAAAGVAFFMKQMTKKAPIPDDLMIRESPDSIGESL